MDKAPTRDGQQRWHSLLGDGGISYFNVCLKAKLYSHISGEVLMGSSLRATYPGPCWSLGESSFSKITQLILALLQRVIPSFGLSFHPLIYPFVYTADL